jgi:hypothetical protein
LDPLQRKLHKKPKQIPEVGPEESPKGKTTISQESGGSLGSADAFRETENLREESDRDWSDRELDEQLGDDA